MVDPGQQNKILRSIIAASDSDVSAAVRVFGTCDWKSKQTQQQLHNAWRESANDLWRRCRDGSQALGRSPECVLRNAIVASCSEADVPKAAEDRYHILKALADVTASAGVVELEDATKPSEWGMSIEEFATGTWPPPLAVVGPAVMVMGPMGGFHAILSLCPPKQVSDTLTVLSALSDASLSDLSAPLALLAGTRRIPKAAKLISATHFRRLPKQVRLALLLDQRLRRAFGVAKYAKSQSAIVYAHHEPERLRLLVKRASAAVCDGDCLGAAVQQLHATPWSALKRCGLADEVEVLIMQTVPNSTPPSGLARRVWSIKSKWPRGENRWLYDLMSSPPSTRHTQGDRLSGLSDRWLAAFLEQCSIPVRSSLVRDMVAWMGTDPRDALRDYGQRIDACALGEVLLQVPGDDFIAWASQVTAARWAHLDRLSDGKLGACWGTATLDSASQANGLSEVPVRVFGQFCRHEPERFRHAVAAALSRGSDKALSRPAFHEAVNLCPDVVARAFEYACYEYLRPAHSRHLASVLLPLLASLPATKCRQLLQKASVQDALRRFVQYRRLPKPVGKAVLVLVRRCPLKLRRQLVALHPELFPTIAVKLLRPAVLVERAFWSRAAVPLAECVVSDMSLQSRCRLARQQGDGLAATAMEVAACSSLRNVETFRKLLDHWMDRLSADVEIGSRFDDLYTTYERPKRLGGTRTITAPSKLLKWGQRAILDGLLNHQPLHDAAHGFRLDHSIVTNAECHVGRRVVVNVDIRGFFPNTRLPLIRRVLSQCLGGAVSKRAFAFMVDVCSYGGGLPTGAPSSPAIGNLVLRSADTAIAKAAAKYDITYTRYADDLTFSGGTNTSKIIPFVERVLGNYGYELDPKKMGIFRKGRQQPVTGLIVNEKANVTRRMRRRLRAAVHARSVGREAHWHGSPMNDAELRGRLAFLKMVQPVESKRLGEQLDEAISRGDA